MRFFLVLMLVTITGCHHQARVGFPHRCETVNLTRDEVATIRLGQERSRAELAKLRADIEACEKTGTVLRKELAKARDHTPWIVVVTVVAVAGIAGAVGIALAK